MKNLISQIDSQRFGFNVAKINAWDNEISDTINELRHLDVKLIISRIPCEQISLINKLEACGFNIKDTQLTYRYTLKNLSSEAVICPPHIQIREVIQSDIPSIENFTQEAFMGYGHYFANERLDVARCAEIYPDWAKNCCINKAFADKVFVALLNDEVAGYMAFQVHINQQTKYATANISAVSQPARGHGIYQLLMKTGLAWCAQQTAEWVEGSAVTINYPVNHALPKLGFKMNKSHHTLHHWLDFIG